MEKQEAIEIFEDLIKTYPRKLNLVFTDNHFRPKSNGCIESTRGILTVNWTKVKELSKEELLKFFCHEIGHNIQYYYIMNKISEVMELLDDYKNNGENTADYLGKRYYNDVKEGLIR